MNLPSTYTEQEKKDICDFIESVFQTASHKNIAEVYLDDIVGKCHIVFVLDATPTIPEDILDRVCDIKYEDLPSGITIHASVEPDCMDRGYGTVLWQRGN